MKVARHEKIIELIRQYEIDTQEELAARLNEAGFKVRIPSKRNMKLISLLQFSSIEREE